MSAASKSSNTNKSNGSKPHQNGSNQMDDANDDFSEENEQNVIRETYPVSTEKINQKLMIVKVPKFLSSALLDKKLYDRSGIATIEGVQGDITLTMRDDISENFGIPKQYKLRERPNADEQSFILNRQNHQGSLNYLLFGKANSKFEAQPVADELYFKLKKSQIKMKNEPERKIKQINHVKYVKPVAHFQEELLLKAKKKESGKRFRGEKQDVYNMLFNAFEKHQYYNIKDLVAITQQPVSFLKEVMKEICNYSAKPPYKNMWELKPEYRHYKKE